MPSHRTDRQELSGLIASLKGQIETAGLFGEREFPAPAAGPAAPPPAAETAREALAPPRSWSKQESLAALHTEYAACRNCALAGGRKNIVFGVGALDPKVLFIGEGPGYEEDRQGLPFVGKAGVLLDKILASIGLDRRTTAYIANVVKCHPLRDPSRPEMRGNDRPPEPDEIEACRPILERQIEILNPPILCALGSVAARALTGSPAGITRIRGQVFHYEFPVSKRKVPLLPTYHPAALLRNEALKKDVWQDMKLLKRLAAENEAA